MGLRIVLGLYHHIVQNGEEGSVVAQLSGSAVQRLLGAKGKTIPELTKDEARALNFLDISCTSVYTGFALIHGTDQDRKNYKGDPVSPERAAWFEFLQEIWRQLLDEIGLVGELAIAVDGEVWKPHG